MIPARKELEPTPKSVELAFNYLGYSMKGHAWFDADEWLSRLGQATVLCFGETDDDPTHKAAEITLLSELVHRAAISGRRTAVALEAFETPFQATLSAYSRKELSLSALFEQLDDVRSSPRHELLAALLQRAQLEQVELWAVGAPQAEVLRVAQQGFAGSAEDERRTIAPFEPDDADQNDEFHALQRAPSVQNALDNVRLSDVRLYRAQSTAHAIVSHFASVHSSYQVLIVADRELCENTAVPVSIRRSLPMPIVSIAPSVSSVEGSPPTQYTDYDYAMVLSPASARE